jgi:hypothetical protein
MPLLNWMQSLPRVFALALLMGLFAVPRAEAHFLDDPALLMTAITSLRLSLGDHPRVLMIEIEPDEITMEVQDPTRPTHVDAWGYQVVAVGPVHFHQKSGPAPVQPSLIDPDLEANLFNLDEIDFGAFAELSAAAGQRAHMQDPPAITRIEIARRLYILPKPTAGDVRWSLHLTTGRESAEIYANAKGTITGADLAETHFAQTVNLFKEPTLIGEAATAFRDKVGAKPIVLSIDVEENSVGFVTNEADAGMGKLMPGLPSNASYSWSLNGLQRRLGTISMPIVGDMKPPTPFGIDEIDWGQVGKLGSDALAKVAIAKAVVHEMQLAKSSRHPGDRVLEWTIDIVDPEGETSKVYADAKGTITEVILPASKRAASGPINWLDPATMAGAISRLGANFPPDTKILEIAFDDRGGHIVIEDPSNGGQLASFDFTATGVQRASITMSMNPGGKRFRIADIASLNAGRLASLEQAAMKKLTAHKKGYLNNLTIGSNVFDPQAGAKAVDIYVRDIPVNSAQANYAWALYSFEGKYIDGTSF